MRPLVLILALLPGRTAWAGALEVVTTTEDLAALVRAVGGDDVRVASISKGTQDPHHVDAKPSYMALMRRADLLVYVGLQLEIGWLPLLIEGARNPDIRPGRPGHLDASAGLQILGRPAGEVDRSQGDVHPEGNPHYWLDPRNALAISTTIEQRLVELAPSSAQAFRTRGAGFRAALQRRIGQWETRAAPLRGLSVVTYHSTYVYLAAWLGLKVVARVEERPGIPPSPRHVAGLIDQMKRARVPILISSEFNPPEVTQAIAERTGAASLVLPSSVGGAPGISDYDALVERMIAALLGAVPSAAAGG